MRRLVPSLSLHVLPTFCIHQMGRGLYLSNRSPFKFAGVLAQVGLMGAVRGRFSGRELSSVSSRCKSVKFVIWEQKRLFSFTSRIQNVQKC